MQKLVSISVLSLALSVFAIASLLTTHPSRAQSIDLLLVERIPVPTKRPDTFIQTGTVPQVAARPVVNQTPRLQAAGLPEQRVSPIRGSLKNGLDALSKGDGARALGIRAGMKAGTLDRKILAWSIALSGDGAVSSGTIAGIAGDLPDWPGQKAMVRNFERALARENRSASQIVSILGKQQPQSVEGAVLLANAYLQLGQRKQANRVIAPVWREERLDKRSEKRVLEKAGSALSKSDHRFRMHNLLYNDRITAATRVQGKAEQTSLAKARAAVIRKNKNAGKLLKAVAPSSKRDTGYLFARIEHARRTEQFDRAAQLLLKAPRDQEKLVNSGEWWVERRIVSRKMLEAGKYRLAYRLVSEHASTEAKDIAEAEFHAGWYALRFLKNSATARKHFSNLLSVATRPLSISRGHYWMGRASKGTKARDHFKQAARYSGTYYGQLAAVELGIRKLSVPKPKPGASIKNRFGNRELVRAIKRLEQVDYTKRADVIYRHLARTNRSPEELAILAAMAERRGNYPLSLQVGKLAYGQGTNVGTLAWPLGAIPTSAKIGATGRALAYAIARQESAFNKAAISPANARGLLQLLPGTAKGVAKRKGLKYSRKRLTRDAAYNATLGAAYLSEQLEDFGNSYVLTFAAYNAGPGRVREWLERFGDPRGRKLHDVVDWVEQIPFTETRKYVQRVMENYQIYKTRISNARLEIASDLTRGRR